MPSQAGIILGRSRDMSRLSHNSLQAIHPSRSDLAIHPKMNQDKALLHWTPERLARQPQERKQKTKTHERTENK